MSLFYCCKKMLSLYMDDWEHFNETLPEKKNPENFAVT